MSAHWAPLRCGGGSYKSFMGFVSNKTIIECLCVSDESTLVQRSFFSGSSLVPDSCFRISSIIFV